MILYRCFAWQRGARPVREGGALWWARSYQGGGRHDNPEQYGCMYAAQDAVSGVVEQLARFRGSAQLRASMLVRRRLPLALASIELSEEAHVVDLDDPAVLVRERLRPSAVATRNRTTTQPQALALWRGDEGVAGLRWWSPFEASWHNVTLFDRAAPLLELVDVRELTLADAAVEAACELLGLARSRA